MVFVFRRWLGYLIFVFIAFLFSILGIWCLGKFDSSTRNAVDAKSRLGDWDRVRCAVPDWLKEKSFLEEVRYLTGFGYELDLLDPELMKKLVKAFDQHPWVEKVVGIKREKEGVLWIDVVFRKPALLISSIDIGSDKKSFRTVDGKGVLLPLDSPIRNLPLLVPDVPKPIVKTGTALESRQVLHAASLVEFLSGFVSLEDTLVDVKGDGMYLRTVSGDLNCKWGAPIGMEGATEPTPQAKVELLRAAFERRGKMPKSVKTELDLTVHIGK